MNTLLTVQNIGTFGRSNGIHVNTDRPAFVRIVPC